MRKMEEDRWCIDKNPWFEKANQEKYEKIEREDRNYYRYRPIEEILEERIRSLENHVNSLCTQINYLEKIIKDLQKQVIDLDWLKRVTQAGT